jgi:putative ABC transport system permease protein
VAGGIREAPRFYIPFIGTERDARLIVRTRGRAEDLVDSIGAIVEHAAPRAALPFRYDGAAARQAHAMARTRTAILAALAGIAVLLSAFGIGALVSYSTSLRVREFGVRSALGATQAMIGGEVIRDSLALCARGLALGAVGSVIAVFVLVPLIYFGVLMINWPIVIGAFAFVLLLTVAASFSSVMRAVRLSPAEVLRAD